MKSQDIRYVNFKRSLELKVCCNMSLCVVLDVSSIHYTEN